MEMQVIIQGNQDAPKLKHLKPPIIDLGQNEKMIVCLVQEGMSSGEPSVLICSSDSQGSVVLQTSLDKYLMAAHTMVAAAESQWGWKQPEGSFSIIPPDREARRAIIEALKAELEGWEDLDVFPEHVHDEFCGIEHTEPKEPNED